MKLKLLYSILFTATLLAACDSKDTDSITPAIPPVDPPVMPDPNPPSIHNLIKTNIDQNTMLVGSENWNAIAYGENKYVAISSNRYATVSTNGVTWTTPVEIKGLPQNVVIYCLTYYNGRFIAGCSEHHIASSTDGATWTITKLEDATNGYYRDFAHGNGKLLAIGSNGYVNASTDGVKWSRLTKLTSAEGYFLGIAYGNGKFVICSDGEYAQYVSTDGITWETVPRKYLMQWDCIEYGAGKFIMLDGYNMISSEDGKTWTNTRRISNINLSSVTGLTYSNGVFAACANYTRYVSGSGWVNTQYVMTSFDGINWSQPIVPTDENGDIITKDLRGIIILP